jgi:UDP-4-amino-4,6-dideoxy-N-acetyl-beta-L-altrosamine N-acetyltransferase
MSELRKMTPAHLEQVLAWRNDDRIRAWMLQPRLISADEHAAWYERVSARPDHVLLIYAEQGRDCGFMQVECAQAGGVGAWGFYASPEAPRGAGTRMGQATLELVFDQIGMHKVHAQVLAGNPASQRMHEKLRFLREGVLASHHRVQDRHEDLICYGLTREQWKNTP